jgi:hypothetical protein
LLGFAEGNHFPRQVLGRVFFTTQFGDSAGNRAGIGLGIAPGHRLLKLRHSLLQLLELLSPLLAHHLLIGCAEDEDHSPRDRPFLVLGIEKLMLHHRQFVVFQRQLALSRATTLLLL